MRKNFQGAGTVPETVVTAEMANKLLRDQLLYERLSSAINTLGNAHRQIKVYEGALREMFCSIDLLRGSLALRAGSYGIENVWKTVTNNPRGELENFLKGLDKLKEDFEQWSNSRPEQGFYRIDARMVDEFAQELARSERGGAKSEAITGFSPDSLRTIEEEAKCLIDVVHSLNHWRHQVEHALQVLSLIHI